MGRHGMNQKGSWDSAWEKVYRGQEWGRYPPEEVVRFIARNYYHGAREKTKILDLGCGTGAVSWFIAREGFRAHGIDGSHTAVSLAKKRLKEEKLKAEFSVGDIAALPYPDNYFDCIVDVNSIQHNNKTGIQRILRETWRVLKPGGRLFSIVVSAKSKLNPASNPFSSKGNVTFFSERDLGMFRLFQEVTVETSTRTDRGNTLVHYIVTGKKGNKRSAARQ